MSSSTPAPASSPSPGWLKWVVLAVIAAIVVFVGGPFAYIHFASSDAPAPLSLTASPATTTAGGTGAPGGAALSSVEGTWKVTNGSQAGYRVKETLFGQSAEAVGRTTALTGQAAIAAGSLTAADFSVDMTKMASDKNQRDGQFQGRIMDTADFPTATFKLTQPVAVGAIPADGQTTTVKATGDLTIRGTTKPVTLDLTAQVSGSTIKVSASTQITFADYNIDNPSGGPATVGDSGQLEFLIVLGK